MHKTFYMYAYVDHAVADPSIREAAFPHGSSSEAQKKTNSPSEKNEFSFVLDSKVGTPRGRGPEHGTETSCA